MKYIMGFRKEKFTQCLEIKTRSLCKCPEKLNAELKYFKNSYQMMMILVFVKIYMK